jgi:enamine deaminase RidA (YjgF/YER057c/UK114 family)
MVRGVKTEARMQEMGLTLPDQVSPKGNYISFVRVGNMAFLSGHLPLGPDGEFIKGWLGKDLTQDQGYEAARLCGLQLIATMKANLGDLDKVPSAHTHIVS